MLPLYNNVPEYLNNKLHKILMKAARAAIGDYCFKKSTSYILGKCKWMRIKDMITYSSLVFINNVIKNKKPKSILNIYKTNRFIRHKAEISNTNIPKNKKYSTFFLQQHTTTYNKIPSEMKEKSIKTFKKELKLWICHRPSDTMD